MAKIDFSFTGNLRELTEFMEATFKDHSIFTLHVAGTVVPKPSLSPIEKLAKELSQFLGCSVDVLLKGHVDVPNGLVDVVNYAKINQKISAIKALRTLTGCGIKEGKDALEFRIFEAINKGQV